MYMVAGVTSAGKTTFARSGMLGLNEDDIVHACELDSKPITKESILHYNLLRPAEFIGSSDRADYYDYYKDPVFSFIEDNSDDLTAIVVVAAKKQVYDRIDERGKSEPDKPDGSYRRDKWRGILDSYNIGEVYERFILHMERLNIPCRFYLSSNNPEEPFREVHRYSSRPILEGRDVASLSTVQKGFKNRFEYQQLHLAPGVVTSGQNRADSFLDALALDMNSKKVLDVGSAIGGLAFSAEQVGASHVVGLEPKPHRFNASVEVGRAIGSGCKFYNETLSSYDLDENFDHIFVLNVMHHMPDFIHDLRTLSRSCNETLTLEFPGMEDHKYLDTFGGNKDFGNPNLPLIGVSTRAKDQTFVFSPEGIRRIMMDHLSEFRSHKIWQSPMRDDRFFMRFVK